MKKRVERKVRGTNIRVVSLKEAADPRIAVLDAIADDDPATTAVFEQLRPLRRLIHPAEAYAQADEKLRPAVDFCTYDASKARARRQDRREKQQQVTEKRRQARLAPTVVSKTVKSATAADVSDMEAEVARLFAKRGKKGPLAKAAAIAQAPLTSAGGKARTGHAPNKSTPSADAAAAKRDTQKRRRVKLGHAAA